MATVTYSKATRTYPGPRAPRTMRYDRARKNPRPAPQPHPRRFHGLWNLTDPVTAQLLGRAEKRAQRARPQVGRGRPGSARFSAAPRLTQPGQRRAFKP